MSTPPRRRSTGSQRHVTGRYREDMPPPVERGLPEQRLHRPGLLLLGGVFLGALSAAVAAAVLLFLLLQPAPPSAHNAIWLGIDWGRETHADDTVSSLAAELRLNGIDTLYIWTSWLQGDGTWSETTFPYIAGFVQQLRRFYPEAQLDAWIGFPVETPSYRMDDATVRDTIATFSERAIQEFGFDGVHLNAEPVWDGDENFPALLRDIRQAIGTDTRLSVSVPPDWNTGTPGIPVGPYTVPGMMWSTEYKQRVALLADEMAVMAYSSGLSTPADYTTWMAFQVTQFISAIAPLSVNTRLIIGIPTYDAEPPGHDPAVESIPAAINGIRQGLAQSGEAASLVRGLGIYAYWTTDAQEWAAYRQMWLGQPTR